MRGREGEPLILIAVPKKEIDQSPYYAWVSRTRAEFERQNLWSNLNAVRAESGVPYESRKSVLLIRYGNAMGAFKTSTMAASVMESNKRSRPRYRWQLECHDVVRRLQ